MWKPLNNILFLSHLLAEDDLMMLWTPDHPANKGIVVAYIAAKRMMVMRCSHNAGYITNGLARCSTLEALTCSSCALR